MIYPAVLSDYDRKAGMSLISSDITGFVSLCREILTSLISSKAALLALCRYVEKFSLDYKLV